MADTVNNLTIRVTITGSVAGDNGVRQPIDITYEKVFTDGTGTNQIGNVYYKDNRPLNATNETLDLDGLTDFQGVSTSTWNNVKWMFFQNNSTTTAEVLTIGGGDFSTPFNAAADKVKIGPAGIFLLVSPIDGYGITASTGDGLLVAHSGNSTYDVALGVDNA
jgi:hypothetical protein